MEPVGTADLTGNGHSALIWRNQNSGEIVGWQLNGNIITAQARLGFQPSEWAIAGFGDFNGSGRQGVLWHDLVDGSVVEWLMNGFSVSPRWVNQSPISQDWEVVATPNVVGARGNGILWSNTATGQQVIWIPGAAGYTEATIGFAPPPWAVQR